MPKLILSLVMTCIAYTMLLATGMSESRVQLHDEMMSQNFRKAFRMPQSIIPEAKLDYAISEIDLEFPNGWTGQFDAYESLKVGYNSVMRPDSFIYSYFDDAVPEWNTVNNQDVFYHPNGKPEVSFYYYWDESTDKWIYEGVIDFEYYPDFRIRQVTQTNIYDQEPVGTAEFFYTPQNRIESVVKTSIVDNITYVSRDRMFYDDRGRVSSYIFQELDANQHWVDLQKTDITYQLWDNSTYEDYANLYLSNFIWQMQHLNPYANVLKLQREDYYFRYATDWEFGYYRTFSYIDSRQLLDMTDWGYNNGWIQAYKHVYSYDIHNDLQYINYYAGDEQGLYIQARYAYYYDSFAAADDPIAHSTLPDLSISPNPFNDSTTLSYRLNQSSPVELSIYNLKGQLVRTIARETKTAGDHTVVWDGLDGKGKRAGSGIYLVRLGTAGGTRSARVVLLK